MDLQISYRVQNWKQYNQALRDRGDLRIWISPDAFEMPRKAAFGRPETYSDRFIELALTLKNLFRLPYRATQGLVDSLLAMQGVAMKCCDYTLLCKRAAKIGISLRKRLQKPKRVTDLVIDSTGLKVFGEGEWKVRSHGVDKRRTWRKLHLAADAKSHQIVGYELTDNKTTDAQALPDLIKGIAQINRAYMDGAYDQRRCYEEIWCRSGRAIVPPRKGAKKSFGLVSIADQLRNLNISGVEKIGRKAWKVGTGYHKRSISETQVGRVKSSFTGNLNAKKLTNQKAEIDIKIGILNRFTSLGMPKTKQIKEWVA